MKSFRHPSETPIYYLTMLLLGGIVVVSALPTVCLMPLLVVGFIALSYWMGQSHHKQLISQAHHITPQSAPQLAALCPECIDRLQPGPAEPDPGRKRDCAALRSAQSSRCGQPRS